MMRRHSSVDPLDGALASLQVHEPDRRRSARIRAHAHRALQRPRLEEHLARSMDAVSWGRTVESAIVSAAAAFYLVEVLRLAVHLSRL